MPNSSQIRASKTVLQITLMIKGYNQKLPSCAIPTASFYLYFSFSCGLILEGVWQWHTFCLLSDHRGDPAKFKKKRKKKEIAFGWIDFLNQFTARSYKTDSTNEAGEKETVLAVPGQQSWLKSNQQILWLLWIAPAASRHTQRLKRIEMKF